MRNSNKRPPRQEELFDDTQLSLRLLKALALVCLGSEDEQREGIDILIDVATTDVRMAKRIIAIMDHNPKIKASSPELYDKCTLQVQPNLAPSRRH
jgi:hypothetical protein